MVKNPSTPASQPRAKVGGTVKARAVAAPQPVVFVPPPYEKRSGYSAEQSDINASQYQGPSTYPSYPESQRQAKVSPAGPVRSWGNGSYDASTGRAARVDSAKGPSGSQVPSAGRHTTGGPGKASRPGRW